LKPFCRSKIPDPSPIELSIKPKTKDTLMSGWEDG